MSIYCDTCGQQIAPTDSQCWHCGQALQPISLTQDSPESSAPLPNVGAVLRYAGLTAVSLLLLILTTRAIGQTPLLQFGGGTALLPGWQSITDSNLQFTLNLPEGWQYFEQIQLIPEEFLSIVSELEGRVGNLVADGALRLVSVAETAVSDDPTPPILLINSSQRFTRLTPEQFLAYAQQESPDTFEFLDSNLNTDAPGPTRGHFRFNVQVGNGRWRCLEQFIPTDTIVYLTTICSPAGQFSTHREDFETILRSFQPLKS